MRILIVGSGGREHALAWKLEQSPLVNEIHLAPGNGGTKNQWHNAPIEAGDVTALIDYIKEKKINFVVPGPELPLVKGLADACHTIGVPCFGPDAYAAQLEGSKIFAKEVMREAGVPTADYAIFTDYAAAATYVKTKGTPIVIKADGLAAGKGVVVAKNEAEALQALEDMLNKNALGVAASRVLIEETLIGEEVSLLAFCDGEHAIPLPSAQDHKTVFDGDNGPNTGGMGAYSPAPLLPDEQAAAMCELVIDPILRVMRDRGNKFIGMLYAGLMFTKQGPLVLEYNTRFGDPECQPLLLRMESDLMEVMLACIKGELHTVRPRFSSDAALCVVLSAAGYPGEYPKNLPITGIEAAEQTAPGKIKVFQAGTAIKNTELLSNGGRVLGITALGKNLFEAQKNAYVALNKISMPQGHFRKDIGNKGLKRETDIQ